MRFSSRFGWAFALVAVCGLVGSAIYAAPAPEVDPDSMEGWSILPASPPQTASEEDGVFLLVSGPDNDSLSGTPGGAGRTLLQFWWPADRTSAHIAVFDADTDGLWDERTGTSPDDVLTQPDTLYEIFLDKTGDVADRLQAGEVIAPFAVRTALEPEINATDATWLQLFDMSLSPSGTLGTNGQHRFVLRVTLLPGVGSEGREVNGFKVAYDGSAQITANSVLGFVGGAVDQFIFVDDQGRFHESSFDLLEAETAYEGIVEFQFDSAAACDIQGEVFFDEADADWNAPLIPDQNGNNDDLLTGLPPDDGGVYHDPTDPPGIYRDSSDLRISPAIEWEFVAPDGAIAFSSTLTAAAGHASGTAPAAGNPFVRTPLQKSAFLAKPGTWTLRWKGVDQRNFVFFRLNIPVGDPPPPCELRGTVLCDGPGQQPIPNALITATDAAGLVLTARTSAAGAYSIPLTSGTWTVGVSEAMLAGFDLSPAGPTQVQVDFADPCDCPALLADFRFQCCAPARVEALVLCDNDGDGFQSPGDTPLTGVEVVVDLAPLPPVFITSGAAPVGVAVPSNTSMVIEVEPGQPALMGGTVITDPISVLGIDCGGTFLAVFLVDCCQPGTVNGRVYCDKDNSGGFTPGDTTFAGVPIHVTPDDGALPPFVATTGADGTFSAPGLAVGGFTFAVDETAPVLAGATLLSPADVDVDVACGATTNVEWRFECPCVCPTQSTTCTGGYNWVQLEIYVFVPLPVVPTWTNPILWTKKKKVVAAVLPPPPPPPVAHVLQVSAVGDAARIAFTGDSWTGQVDRGILHVTEIRRVAPCRWKVKVKVWACDRADGTRGCLPRGVCVRVRLDGGYQAVCLDLSCANGPLALGLVADDCGNPWYAVLGWVSCADAACCPPNPCCTGPCCPAPPPNCPCARP